MKHVVSISGGTASAVAAERVMRLFGRANTTLWFSDTSWEDGDLHRFLADCYERWDMQPVVYRDGRTPLQVAEDVKLIPNQRRAPCSRILKQEPFFRWLTNFREQIDDSIMVHLGLNWMETHRFEAPRERYETIPGVTVAFPLSWRPFIDVDATVRSWGIEPPRLYKMGFPHNNCGGRCVRQGIKEWQRLKTFFPKRFSNVRDWEQAQRAIGDARASYAIARDQRGGSVVPLTLADVERREFSVEVKPVQDDLFGCFCDY